MNDPLHCYILYDLRNHSSFFVGRSPIPLDEILFHHMHYPEQYPFWVARLIAKIYLSGSTPEIFRIHSSIYAKAKKALEKRAEGRRDADDPITIPGLLAEEERVRRQPLTEQEVFEIHVMRHVHGRSTLEIMRTMSSTLC